MVGIGRSDARDAGDESRDFAPRRPKRRETVHTIRNRVCDRPGASTPSTKDVRITFTHFCFVEFSRLS